MPIGRIWELLSRKYNDEISQEELRELEQLLVEHQDVFQMDEFLTGLHELPLQSSISPADVAKSRDIISAAINESPTEENPTPLLDFPDKVRSGFRAGYRWISAATILVIAFSAFLWLRNKQASKVNSSVPANEVATTGGSKTKVFLPDGSSVFLNAGSKIFYNKDFGITDREITLDGEAFFDIAKNEKVPLTVRAGNVSIRVLGTAFNVRAYSEDSIVETSLIRGLVEVWSNNDVERKVLIRPREKITIGKSTRLYSDEKDGEPKKQDIEVFTLAKIKINPRDSIVTETAWTQEKLVFKREPFVSLAQKMERWYNVKINFSNTSLYQLTFTGSLEKETLTEALEALRKIEPFNYSIENRTVTITNK